MVAVATGDAASATRDPRATALACLERCAGLRKAAVGARVAITGRHLSRVAEVQFRGRSGFVGATPASVGRHRIEVVVPRHAHTGRPRIVDAGSRRRPVAESLRIVPARRLPAPDGFSLLGTSVRPHKAFVDGRRAITLSYRFRARAAAGVEIEVVRADRVARRWIFRRALPYRAHRLRWHGMRSSNRTAPRGRYRFKIRRLGHPAHSSPAFRLHDGKFPVRASHGYGGAVQRFGALRTGGRVHQGQDVFAACGTRMVAARGGRVQARGSDPVLYGNWVVIDGRGTKTDYRYAHLRHPATVHDRERVRTGEPIGRVGKTGNARSVGCMLHFEAWPRGWNNGRPVDPRPILRRWDRWS
jgi:murein DD-endopeptidase MepM/ murein hydrolase activator NlpD